MGLTKLIAKGVGAFLVSCGCLWAALFVYRFLSELALTKAEKNMVLAFSCQSMGLANPLISEATLEWSGHLCPP